MSMRDYSYTDYGLVLDSDTIKNIYMQICEDIIDVEDMGYELYEKGLCEYTGEFTGEATAIKDDGGSDWSDSIVYNGEVIYYIPLNKYPSLFNKPYNSIDEIIEELKEKIGQYMLEDYNYRGNIRHIVGTTFG